MQRLLVRARNEGIVEIKINFPFEVCLELRQRLETLYGLRQAAVVPAAWTDEDLENALGESEPRCSPALWRMPPPSASDGASPSRRWCAIIRRSL